MDRRSFLIGAGIAGVAAAVGGRRPAAATTPLAAGGGVGPFGLGVAAGEPATDGFVLWTRLVRDISAPDGGMGAMPVPVRWQVAHDDRFRHVVDSGTFLAVADDAHTVHAVAHGLRPGRPYWYRFRVGGDLSPVGRARTLPDPEQRGGRLRVATAADVSYAESLFPGYAALATEDDLDLVLFLGDYIYDDDPRLRGRVTLRPDTVPESPPFDQLTTLTDYRRRYASYKADPFLQAAHAAAAWIAVPDDHEVEDNYGSFDDVSDRGLPGFSPPAVFARQRANAYKAYWEHLPLHPDSRPDGPFMRLHRAFSFGRLAALHVLDTRQFRQHPALFVPGNYGPEVFGRTNPGSMLGADQEAWFARSFAERSSARWQLIGQSVPMMQARLLNPFGSDPPTLFAYDQWDGYGPARRRLLSTAVSSEVDHLVVLSADIHAAAAGQLRLDFDDPSTPAVGSELITSALSTGLMADDSFAVLQASNPLFNPHIAYVERINGYLLTTVERDRLTAEFRQVADVRVRVSTTTTRSTFVIDHDDGALRRV